MASSSKRPPATFSRERCLTDQLGLKCASGLCSGAGRLGGACGSADKPGHRCHPGGCCVPTGVTKWLVPLSPFLVACFVQLPWVRAPNTRKQLSEWQSYDWAGYKVCEHTAAMLRAYGSSKAIPASTPKASREVPSEVQTCQAELTGTATHTPRGKHETPEVSRRKLKPVLYGETQLWCCKNCLLKAQRSDGGTLGKMFSPGTEEDPQQVQFQARLNALGHQKAAGYRRKNRTIEDLTEKLGTLETTLSTVNALVDEFCSGDRSQDDLRAFLQEAAPSDPDTSNMAVSAEDVSALASTVPGEADEMHCGLAARKTEYCNGS